MLPFGSGIPNGALSSSESPVGASESPVGASLAFASAAWEAGSALTNSLARSSTGVQPPSKEAARLARSAGATQQVASAATGLTMYLAYTTRRRRVRLPRVGAEGRAGRTAGCSVAASAG